MNKISSTILSSCIILGTISLPPIQPTALAQVNRLSRVAFLNGVWEGHYICGQGITNLRLTIEAKSTTNIDAIFLFYEHSLNQGVPLGQFRMEGTLEVFDNPGIPDILDLRATNWVNQPSGYVTVNLIGDVSPSQRKITGNVIGRGCTRFEVIKREF